jgi:hypothetical protein
MSNQIQNQAIHAYTSADNRDNSSIAFIHKELDDFGLDPYSFRVYSHIVRRAGNGGECWESNKNMADVCCMSESQVKRSLALLVKYGLIFKESRLGTTDLYRVAPRSNWSNPIRPTTPIGTDSSHRTNRNFEVIKNTNIIRLVPAELGGRSGRTRGVGLVELQSISHISKSNKDLERSVVEEVQEVEVVREGDNSEVQEVQNFGNTSEPKEGLDRNPKPILKANNSALIENDSQNWQCPEPKLRREFMKWLSDTGTHIQTARHASNWCNKYPHDADLVWDDFMSAKNEVEDQNSRFASYLPQQHELLAQKYKSAVRDKCMGCGVFLDQFIQEKGAWLNWAKANYPEWLDESA